MAADDLTTADMFLDAVRRVAGDDGVAKLRALAGGKVIEVPITPSEASVITRALGMSDALKVCREMLVHDGDGRAMTIPRFYLPTGRYDTVAAKLQAVERMHKAGYGAVRIATELGTTERTVRKHISVLRSKGLLPPTAVKVERIPKVAPSRRGRMGKKTLAIYDRARAMLLDGASIADVMKCLKLSVVKVRGCRTRLVQAGKLPPLQRRKVGR